MTSDRSGRTLRVHRRRARAGDASWPDGSLVHSLDVAVDRGLIASWHIEDAAATDAFALEVDDDALIAPDAVSSLVRALDAGAGLAEARVIPGAAPVEYVRYTGEIGASADRGLRLVSLAPASSTRRVFEPAAAVYLDAAPAPAGESRHRPGALDRLDDLAGARAGGGDRPRDGGFGPDDGRPRPLDVTVVIPTRASRPESLKDALLGLSGQVGVAFEVLLAVSGAVDENAADLAELVSRLEPRMRSRVTLITSEHGPGDAIDSALARADGRMTLVIDETDVAGPTLLAGIAAVGDVVVIAPALRQVVEPELWPGDQDGYRALTAPHVPSEPWSSSMSHRRFAIPMRVVDRFGARVDRADEVAPWADLVDRVAAVAGVAELGDHRLTIREWHGLDDASADERRFADDAELAWVQRRPHSFIFSAGDASHASQEMDPDAARLHRMLFAGGGLRRPVRRVWRLIAPGIAWGARLRRRLRRDGDG